MAVEIPGYTDLVEIGRGGFAVVYRAHQQGFGRTVAVKVLARLNVDDRTRRRFDRECEVMGALSWHPHIVVVYDNGSTTEGQPFIAMEYLAEGSLGDRVRLGRSLAEEEVLRWGVQVAGALQTAHDAGVLHRDLKPENALLDVFGQAKLGDFGIAGITGSGETTTGSASFTVVHAAPEVLEGQPATERSDVYSFGSTLFHLLAGTAAFRRAADEPISATLLRVLRAPVPDLRERGVADDLASLVEWTMQKEPAERPSSAAAVGAALQVIERSRGRTPTEMRLHPRRAHSAALGGRADSAEVPGTSDPSARGGPPAPLGGADGSTHPGLAAASAETVDLEPAGSGSEAPTIDVASAVPSVPGDSGDEDLRAGSRPASARSGPPPRRGRRRLLVGVGVVGVVLLLVVGALVLSGGDGAEEPDARTAAPPTVTDSPSTSAATTTTALNQPEGTTTVIPVGTAPRGIAMGGGSVWVANSGSDTVSRFPIDGVDVTATIDVGGGPRGIAFADGFAWVANAADSTVAKIDPETNAVVDTIDDVGSGPSWVTSGEGSIWVASVAEDSISRIDPVTDEVTGSHRVGDAPSGIVVANGSVWVANFDSESVSQVNPSDLSVVATIPVDVGPGGITATDDRLWVADTDAQLISEIDLGSGEVIDRHPFGQRPGGIAADGETVWVSASDTHEVVRIDAGTALETGRFPVGQGPRAVVAGAGAVFTADLDANQVTRVAVGP